MVEQSTRKGGETTNDCAPTNDHAAVKSRSLAAEIGLIVLLIGGMIASLSVIDRYFQGALAWAFSTALLLVVVPLILFALLERVVTPAGPRKSLRQWLLHLRINIFTNYLSTITLTLVVASLTAALNQRFSLGLIDLRVASGGGAGALLGALFISLAVGDFFFYWYHRCQHKSNILWQIHKVHHMDPAVDVLTDGRHNWIDQVPRVLFMFIPMAVLFKLDSVDPLHVGLTGGLIVGSIQILHRSLLHFNARWHWGWATGVICGPQVHRIHHSRLPQHRDKNFAGVLPLWDILFGTYYAPARHEYPPTGVDGEPEFQTFFEAQAITLREWWNMLSVWRRRRAGVTSSSDDPKQELIHE